MSFIEDWWRFTYRIVLVYNMERVPTDTDAGPQSVVGVGVVDTTTKAFHETQPSWLQDGYGVRGPQQPRQREATEKPTPMDVGMPSGRKGGGDSTPGACAPTAPPDTTNVYVWGVNKDGAGVCGWIPICEAPCP